MSTQAVPGLDGAAGVQAPAPSGTLPPPRRLDVASLILCRPLYFMLALLVLEALLSATTTYLVIKAGRDVASGYFVVTDLLWIFCAQAASYISGAMIPVTGGKPVL